MGSEGDRPERGRGPSAVARVLAWGVHAFTASGLFCAFLALLATERRDFRAALLWLGAALAVDCLDGALARAARVAEILPRYDGRMLDFVADFLNFVFLPALLLYRSGRLGVEGLPWIALILFSAAYHFGNRDAVSETQEFVGFPAFWNLVAFYLLLLDLAPAWNRAAVGLVAVLHFVPIRFAYPTRDAARSRFRAALAAAWLAAALATAWRYPEVPPALLALDVGLLAAMAALSLRATFHARRASAAP